MFEKLNNIQEVKEFTKPEFNIEKLNSVLNGKELPTVKEADAPLKFKALEKENNLKALTDVEKQNLNKKINMSESTINKLTVNKNGVYHIKTNNEGLVGKINEDGIKYDNKNFVINNAKFEGVFPKFDSILDVKIEQGELPMKDAKEFKYCNSKLANEVKVNPKIGEKFTPEQLAQIGANKAPNGFTWHHTEEVEIIQLVKSDVHDKSRHTGGKAIWDGGKGNRY